MPISVKTVRIALVLALTPALVLAQPSQDGQALERVAAQVERAKTMIANPELNFFSENSIAHAQATRQVLLDAEAATRSIQDRYYAALSFLLIAEGYAWFQPELPRPFERNPDGTNKLWFPYKDAMRVLEEALFISGWLKKTGHPNKYGLIGDISFFAHLHYDYLRSRVEPIQPDDMSSMAVTERPSRICYTRALHAVQQAFEAELLSAESVQRQQSGIRQYSAKAYLYREAEARLKRNGIDSSEPPLIDVPPQRPDSLRGLARYAAQQSEQPFGETRTFRFFDFLGELFIPKYNLAKMALGVIFG